MELRRYLRLKPYINAYRRLDITPIQSAKGRRDDAELRERIPDLQEYEALATPARDALRALHATYITSVSNDIMAASLELSAFLQVFCQVGEPAKVADLGSGFSSFVLRRYAATAATPCEVHSVDDHGGWLDKTREYLTAQGVSADNVWLWSDFISTIERGSFDMVLHDMGSMEFRASSLREVLTLTRKGGHVVLDDVHKPEYRRHVHQLLETLGLDFLSLKQITCDDKARYAYLVFT
jgi:predicted O-methyltransferase YrrM